MTNTHHIMAQLAFEPPMATHRTSWDHELRDTLTRKHFAMCLGLATELLGLVAQQNGPNPTYGDLQDMMDM